MPNKTKTVVLIESHQQTIIRRSRRVVSAQVMTVPPERPIQEKRKSLGRWWKTFALKSATALVPWSRRLKHYEIERRNKEP